MYHALVFSALWRTPICWCSDRISRNYELSKHEHTTSRFYRVYLTVLQWTHRFPRDFFQERGGLVLICRQKEHRCILIFLARLVAFRSVRNTFPFNSRMLSVLNPPFTSQFVSLFPSRSTLIPNPKKMPCFNDNVTDLGLGICRGKSLPYTLNSEIQR